MYKKLIATVLLVFMLVCINFSKINNVTFNSKYVTVIDNVSKEYIEDSFKKTLYAYGIARGINGLISLFKGTELDLSPAGVGITVAMGEILDPIDDLIERFSWVMLASLISLGIQRFIVEISPYISINILLNIFSVLLLLIIWVSSLKETKLFIFSLRLLAAALLLRLLIPSFSYANNAIYNAFFSQEYEQTIIALEIGKNDLEHTYNETNLGDDSFISDLKNLIMDRKTVKSSLNKLKDKIVLVTDHIINLLIIFIISSIIIPIFLLWLVVKLLLKIFSVNFPLGPYKLFYKV